MADCRTHRPGGQVLCSCQNGQAVKDCPQEGLVKCESCNKGYRLQNERCEANVCICNHGIPAEGPACHEEGAHVCGFCRSGYHLKKGKTTECVQNICTCRDGEAARGERCTMR